MLASEEEIQAAKFEVSNYLLARDLGVTPDVIEEKPYHKTRKWSVIRNAIQEAENEQLEI